MTSLTPAPSLQLLNLQQQWASKRLSDSNSAQAKRVLAIVRGLAQVVPAITTYEEAKTAAALLSQLKQADTALPKSRLQIVSRKAFGQDRFEKVETAILKKELEAWEGDSSVSGEKRAAVLRILKEHKERRGSLSLSGLELSALPTCIGRFFWLTGLDLSSNKLTTLFPEIAQLEHLRKLSIRENLFGVLPDEVDTLYLGPVGCVIDVFSFDGIRHFGPSSPDYPRSQAAQEAFKIAAWKRFGPDLVGAEAFDS